MQTELVDMNQARMIVLVPCPACDGEPEDMRNCSTCAGAGELHKKVEMLDFAQGLADMGFGFHPPMRAVPDPEDATT